MFQVCDPDAGIEETDQIFSAISNDVTRSRENAKEAQLKSREFINSLAKTFVSIALNGSQK